MVGGHFHTILHATSRSSLLKSTTSKPFFNNTIKFFKVKILTWGGIKTLKGMLKVQATQRGIKNLYQNYGQASNGNRSRLMEERAPSTAEEFQRVAEEKARETKEGVATQNVDKLFDGAQIGESKIGSVKN
ncbi:hypothetical protein V8G54_037582 [Vigna mungo]|uniref:Uncharacterized protein n=1 Tax=Vigna mungo TaxID=3915 RepID=A0AAQ3RGM5_VIGMU